MRIFLLLIAIVFLIHLGDSPDDQNTPQGHKAEKSLCAREVEQNQNTLFPRDGWIETEGYIVSIAHMFGLNFDEMENRVSKYEVGRFYAAQYALSKANTSPACAKLY